MQPGGNPFQPQPPDPFGDQPGPGFGAPHMGVPVFGSPAGPPYGPPSNSGYNTFAVLSPVLGVLVPPAGVALGHLALPQIRRTGERGRGAAIAGLVIGYLMCVALIGALIWWATGDHSDSASTVTTTTTATTTAPRPARTQPSVVTSVAPPVAAPRIKVDLATVPIGTCVEVQLRSSESVDALDLFRVDCERRPGVYTVAQRVGSSSQCNSTYVAAPPDRSFALCLNPY